MQSEQKLIERLNSETHKDAAFRELLSLYKERLYWHIRHIVKSHEDADDVLQDTLIKIYKHIGNFKGNSQLYSWMYRIATNQSLTFLNKKAKRFNITNQELQNITIQNLEADVYFESDAIKIKLQEAISSLPEKQQMVFNMRYFQDIKYRNMAEILNTSEGALKASYHIAMKKVEEYLKKH